LVRRGEFYISLDFMDKRNIVAHHIRELEKYEIDELSIILEKLNRCIGKE